MCSGLWGFLMKAILSSSAEVSDHFCSVSKVCINAIEISHIGTENTVANSEGATNISEYEC